MPRRFRAAVIGSTGRGDYGHALDVAFKGIANVDLVAVADDNPKGLEAAGRKIGVKKLYRDYRDLLVREKPDVVAVCPRHVDQRVAMVTACAEAGCHVYCEKPLAADLADADAMLAACAKAKVKLAVAHQFRAMPPVRQALAAVAAGKYGKLVRVHARPKDDHRGGGEELIVHGTHLMDLMLWIAGTPRWVSGHVTQDGRDVTRADARKATEPLGPVAGNSIAAVFGMGAGGVRAHFDSTANLHRNGRTPYGVRIECEEAMLLIRSPGDVWVHQAATAQPENPKLTWQKTWVEDWHFTADHKPRPMNDWIVRGNQILVRELLEAIEKDTVPTASGADARLALEMIQGVYASHLAEGRRVVIPAKERRHPLSKG